MVLGILSGYKVQTADSVYPEVELAKIILESGVLRILKGDRYVKITDPNILKVYDITTIMGDNWTDDDRVNYIVEQCEL